MPTFDVEEIEIGTHEFVDSCDTKEVEDLIKYLIKLNMVTPRRFHLNKPSISEILFDSHLNKLYGKSTMMSSEDEETIIAIAKKYDF